MDYKGNPGSELSSDVSLPDKLNDSNTHFEARKTEACMRATAFPEDCVITLSVADVSKTFKQVKITRTCTQSMCEPTGKCLH